MSRNRQTFANVSNLFIRGCFHPDLIGANAHCGSQAGFHGIQKRTDPGTLCNHHAVHVADHPASKVGFLDRFFQNFSGVNSPDGWICVRKPMADVRKSQRSKNGIRQRMGQAIGIRMPFQSHLARNRYATQHKGAVHNQTVNVVSVANSHSNRLDDTPKSVQFILDQIAGSSKDEFRILLKFQCGIHSVTSENWRLQTTNDRKPTSIENKKKPAGTTNIQPNNGCASWICEKEPSASKV